jgi:hypothetical protein
MTDEQLINDYLSVLRANLGPISLSDREEIVLEIRAHIRDSAEQSGASTAAVLDSLGPARELAWQYRDGLLISRASGSLSPLILLRATFRLAAKGVSGLLIFLAGMFGYAIGGGLVLTAMLKPFLPTHTGLWISGGNFEGFGVEFGVYHPASHEILGWWYTPIVLTVGSLLMVATSLLIRGLVRLSKNVSARLTTSSMLA